MGHSIFFFLGVMLGESGVGRNPVFFFCMEGEFGVILLFISKVLQRPMYHLQKINDITRMGKGTLTLANF